MDRDNRWDRVQRAYDAHTGRKVERTAKSAGEAVEYFYANTPLDSSRNGDEFHRPHSRRGCRRQADRLVKNGDAVIFFNFRGDRPRELTRAFIDDKFRRLRPRPEARPVLRHDDGIPEGPLSNVILPQAPR
jgi:2,3-bisphosphoglycerate-independent phosphoglycerate mutase